MAARQYKGFPRTDIKKYLSADWWAGVTIPQVLERQTTLHPEKMAVVAGGGRWTYQELLRGVRRAALAFAGLGFRQGDRVLLQLPNIAEFVLCYLGLQRIGAVPVLCLPRFSLREIDYFINLARARSWITYPKSHGEQWNLLLTQVRDRHPELQVITIGAAGPLEFERLLEPIEGTDTDAQKLAVYPHDACALCHLMPTGGTTGLPKLVPRTHNDYLCNSRFRSLRTGRSAEDISLIATPITHNMAIEVSLVPSLWTGGTVVLTPSTAAGAVLENIESEKVTFTILVPAQLHDLVNHPDLERVELSSLRVLCGAGDRIPPELITEIQARIGIPFIHVFGMAEGPCANTKLDDSLKLVRSTVGFPICPGDEFHVVDEEGKTLPCDQDGELVARGPGVFRGYFQGEVINRDSFLPGKLFRTGDLARIDREGRITLIGRRKDVIVRGGEKISAALIEHHLSRMPEISRAAVAGIPDARLGERICAFIEPAPGRSPTVEGIAQFFKKEGISLILCPERIEFVSSLPLTPVGKLDRARLRKIAASLPASSEPPP
jgi:2,3-dihydroxybenzoate-AMP ligase